MNSKFQDQKPKESFKSFIKNQSKPQINLLQLQNQPIPFPIMTTSISNRQKGSNIPVQRSFNNWLTDNEQKSFTSTAYQSTKLMSETCGSSFMENPESFMQSRNKEQQQQSTRPRVRRACSAFRNNQSRVSGMHEDLIAIAHQLTTLRQTTKRTHIDVSSTRSNLLQQLTSREQSMTHQLQSLAKLLQHTTKTNTIRSETIRNDAKGLRDQYNEMKNYVRQVNERLSRVEEECGFLTFKGRVFV